MRYALFLVVIVAAVYAFVPQPALSESLPSSASVAVEDFPTILAEPVGQVHKSDAEWKKILTALQFYVLREKGTERAFSGKLLHKKDDGVFVCAACGNPLFSSTAKYDSRTGWPSFWRPIGKGRILLKTDRALFMTRTELVCGRCGGHLGHVFDDGPQPTGKRYCINSTALDFIATAR
ncbi:MAG: peptide-methionine (R)-S-oxide reductase MsrB [Mariprofundaceae bacterium]|nr:peptide-methionine (R)-S-oxide reductase MsrB [Mariprofundaceae bacterium]